MSCPNVLGLQSGMTPVGEIPHLGQFSAKTWLLCSFSDRLVQRRIGPTNCFNMFYPPIKHRLIHIIVCRGSWQLLIKHKFALGPLGLQNLEFFPPLRLSRCFSVYRGHLDLVLVATQDLSPMHHGRAGVGARVVRPVGLCNGRMFI